MIRPVAMHPNEVEDASCEFDMGAQIVSRLPDQSPQGGYLLNSSDFRLKRADGRVKKRSNLG
jgi:hypothetical protein